VKANRPEPKADEEAPPSILPQAVIIGILAMVGLGFAVFEVLGLRPDELGGFWALAGGGLALIIILRIALRA